MQAMIDRQFEVNARVYHAPGVERLYKSRDLTRAEVAALLKHQPAFAGRDVLDIGVGTGRTAIYLAPLARRYEAIDYSPVMVVHVRTAMPHIAVREADMRDLSAFGDASFDFIFATNNVFDAVGHEDRLRTLAEARRVLRPAGMLMFSSHNRCYRDAFRGPRLRWSGNPIAEIRNVVRWVWQMANYARVGKLRHEESDYALLDDTGHDYACLHYYIDPPTQRRQLSDVGFEVIDVLDSSGNHLEEGYTAPDSPWLMYVARVGLH
jgi:SAM-dependent methyltransferase